MYGLLGCFNIKTILYRGISIPASLHCIFTLKQSVMDVTDEIVKLEFLLCFYLQPFLRRLAVRRDGRQAQSVLYYNREDLGKPIVHDEVRDYCELNTCRRAFLSSHFGSEVDFTGPGHDCRDNCEKNCSCENCINKSPDSSMQHHEMDFDPEIATMMNDLLNQLFFDINSFINSAIEPTFISGLS